MNIELITKIKNEMTEGEFGHINKFVANRPHSERMANTAARSIAVNETFVKNINPLKIEQMLKALECVQHYLMRTKTKSVLSEMVDEALTDARIPSHDTETV